MKVISVENLSKSYRLGQIGSGTFFRDFERRLARLRRRPDPYARIGEDDHGNRDGEEIWALRDVSFEVRHGEVLGIIGRNGAGKSTLLKILSQVTAPTSGQIKVRGRIASLLEVGTGFHPELTGRENIYLNGAILGMTRAEVRRKFDEIVDFAGVEQFIGTPVKRYSSGMYVRLAFAVAAHLDPEILIVDEVLAVGDAEFQKKCLGKIGEVAKQGRTVLFVSHNMAAVEALCGDVVVLMSGHIFYRGKPHTAIRTYLQQTEAVQQISLRDRQDRSGDASIRITGVQLQDSQGNPLEAPMSGEKIVIVLDYEAKGVLGNVSISLGFYGVQGQFLLMCSNELTGETLQIQAGQGKMCCVLPKLPFTAGSYSINIYCEVHGVLADWVQDAFRMDVTEGDFYGSGRTPKAGHGGFLASQAWSVAVLPEYP